MAGRATVQEHPHSPPEPLTERAPTASRRSTDRGHPPSRGSVCVEELWEHHDYLAAISRRIVGDPQTAEDLVQEAYVRAIQHLDQLDPAQSVRAWLATVVRRASIDELRRRGRHAVPVEILPERLPAVDSEALDAIVSRETIDEARLALGQLKPRERRLLLQRVAEGRSMAELAAAEGSSVRAVESVLNRARSKLAASVGRGLRLVAPLGAAARFVQHRAWNISARLHEAGVAGTAGFDRSAEVGGAFAVAAALTIGSWFGVGASDFDRVWVTGGEAPVDASGSRDGARPELFERGPGGAIGEAVPPVGGAQSAVLAPGHAVAGADRAEGVTKPRSSRPSDGGGDRPSDSPRPPSGDDRSDPGSGGDGEDPGGTNSPGGGTTDPAKPPPGDDQALGDAPLPSPDLGTASPNSAPPQSVPISNPGPPPAPDAPGLPSPRPSGGGGVPGGQWPDRLTPDWKAA